jgi:murein hydrolase activator
MKQRQIIWTMVFLLTGTFSLGAQTTKQKALEQQRQQLLEEISVINELLFATKDEKSSLLVTVQSLDQKISVRQNLMRITNEQANLLTREINGNLNSVEQLKKELSALKEDYAAMILKSYKSKSQQSRLMFLLSAENFLQAYKRLQYMQQYSRFRRKQGLDIEQRTLALNRLNQLLIEQKKDKEQLVIQSRQEKAQLAKEKAEQEVLLLALKKEEQTYGNQIRTKQKEARKIELAIDALIKAAIAEANKAKGGAGANAAVFDLTPEAEALAADFKNNQGKLIWPVAKGRVMTPFGKRQHPQFPNVTQDHNGVEIITESNAEARAVFSGEVLQIQQLKGANKAVYVRHGNYITIYNNLAKVMVKKGQRVYAKQPLGTVFTHPTTGQTILKFFVYQNTQKLNPASWIYKM